MKRYFSVPLFCFLTGVIFFSCKKDKDTSPPVISILEPKANTSYGISDLIYVEAKISDDVQLFSASIQLLNEDLTPAQSISNTAAQGKNFSLNKEYEIYDSELSSGNYYLNLSLIYGPDTLDWTYQAPVPADFYAPRVCGAQRLTNRNNLNRMVPP